MKKGYLPVLVLFLIVNALSIVLKARLLAAGIDNEVLIIGNAILFVITLVSMYMNAAAIRQRNTQGFIRNIYGGFMLKFFLVVLAVVLYVVLAKPINKPALFTCMGLYLIYTFAGTRSVLHQNKPVAHGNGKSSL